MGYYSSIRGEITVDPPATWAEIRALGEKDRLFRFAIISAEIETPEGTLIQRCARSIEPVYDEATKAYSVESDLAELVAGIPGRTFSGEFRIEGEDTGDVARLFVDEKGKVVHWKARLLWPDGTSEPGR